MKTFKEWVEKHNPELKWDWNNPRSIITQLNGVIKECGNLDIATVFEHMFANDDPGLTTEQVDQLKYVLDLRA